MDIFGGTFSFEMMFSYVRDMGSSFIKYIKDLLKKPTSLDQYYSIGKVMISKNIVKLIFIVLTIISTIYLIVVLPEKMIEYFNREDGNRIYTKYYTSRMLKKYEGVIKVVSKKNKAKYVGSVANGAANGKGTLYDKKERRVYDGDFVSNKYTGVGTLYYSDGYIQYMGDFKENLFSGKGKLYYPNHNLNYEGDFIEGRKEGNGLLCNNQGLEIFNGIFANDKPAIDKYIGMASEDLGNFFIEDGLIYVYDNNTSIVYKNLGVMVCLRQDDETLEGNGHIEKIYVLNNRNFSDEPKLERNKLDKKMLELKGVKKYTGYTRVMFNEMSAIDYLRTVNSNLCSSFSQYNFGGQFSDVLETKEGKSTDKVYVQAYKTNYLDYIFYFNDKDEPYIFYSIERAN